MTGSVVPDIRSAVPAAPGSYLFVLHLTSNRRIRVGRLGRQRFPAGLWLYAGSARGPGGLRARLCRHWDGGERLHWHVDYLRRAGQPAAAAWVPGRSVVECRWARRLASVGDLEPGPAGFGASDCRCPTHLFRVLTRAWTTTELAHRLAPLLSYHDWVEASSAP